jgi:hypothetical protein
MSQNPFASKERAWNLYLSAIEGFFDDPGLNLTIQPLAAAKQADWDYPNAKRFNTYKQWQIANQIFPWAGYGTELGKSFENQWELFLYKILSSVKPIEDRITPEDKKRMEELDDRRDDAFRRKRILEDRLDKQYEEHVKKTSPTQRKSKSDFLRDHPDFNEVQNLDGLIKDLNARVTAIRLKYADLSLIEINKAINEWNTPDGKFKLPERLEDEEDTGNHSLFSKQWIDGDIVRFKSETNTRTYVFDSQKVESSTVQTNWGGSLGIDLGFWGFGGGASGSTMENRSSTEITQLDMSFDNVQEFPIRRGRWFDIGLIEKYGKNLLEFWGPSGSMNVIPVSVILVRGTQIKVTASSTYVSEFVKQFNGSAGLRIGPFRIKGGGGKFERHYSFKHDATSFEIKDESGLPDIVAFKCYTPFTEEANRFFIPETMFNLILNATDMVPQATKTETVA